MQAKCLNCRYARQTGRKDQEYVGCALVTEREGDLMGWLPPNVEAARGYWTQAYPGEHSGSLIYGILIKSENICKDYEERDVQ